jgi:hypothetical protein
MLKRGVAVALLVFLPGLAAAQSPDSTKPKPLPGPMELGLNDSTSRRIANDMAQDMGKLRKVEAAYYAAHKVYAYTLADLAPFALTPGNVVVITPADGGGYKAVMTNPGLSGAEFEADVPAPSH